jgi:hypothetical protein
LYRYRRTEEEIAVIKEGEKWFAPGVRWGAVDVDAANFRDLIFRRFEGFYLAPAEELLHGGHDFAAGVLVLSAMDAVGRLWTAKTGNKAVGRRFRRAATLAGIESSFAHVFYDFYRNGLLHEARIKSGACFDQESTQLIRQDGAELIVNPRLLLAGVRALLQKLIDHPTRFEGRAVPMLRSDIEQR